MSNPMSTPPAEYVQATIPGATVKAGPLGLNARLHTIVITNYRLLFVRSTTADFRRIAAELKQQARDAGKGRIGQWGAQQRAQHVLAQECAAMAPADLLARHPKNFAIDLATVTKLKLKRVENYDASENRLSIKTTGKNYKLLLNGISVADARQTFLNAGLKQGLL